MKAYVIHSVNPAPESACRRLSCQHAASGSSSGSVDGVGGTAAHDSTGTSAAPAACLTAPLLSSSCGSTFSAPESGLQVPAVAAWRGALPGAQRPSDMALATFKGMCVHGWVGCLCAPRFSSPLLALLRGVAAAHAPPPPCRPHHGSGETLLQGRGRSAPPPPAAGGRPGDSRCSLTAAAVAGARCLAGWQPAHGGAAAGQVEQRRVSQHRGCGAAAGPGAAAGAACA